MDVVGSIDLLRLTTISASTVLNFLEACAEDDIQPLVLPPLERFGAGLLVDEDRIIAGVETLKKTENKIVPMLKLVIGLSGHGLAKALRNNINLTASFLFTIACSPCFTVEETGKLIHKMMALKGILVSYPIPSATLSQFARNVTGYGDIMERDVPSELYKDVAKAVREKLPDPDALPSLFDTSPVEKLAELLHKVFEELQNADNKHITIEGCRTGIWLATVLLWLRGKEVDLSVNGFRILPKTGETNSRLSINLIRDVSRNTSEWRIHAWHPQKDLNKLVIRMDNMMQYTQPHHHYPLSVARYQMANSSASSQVLEATGYLAAGLVDTAYEQGYLCNKNRSLSLPLQAICSDYFQNSYRNIIKCFGWEDLNNARQSKIADVLRDYISKARSRIIHVSGNERDDVDFIGTAIQECDKNYFDTYGEPMLVNRDGSLSQVIEQAIHLATEALLFSFCFELPVRAAYRPYTTYQLRSNAEILRKLLFGPSVPCSSDTQPMVQGYPFREFQVHAIQALLQGVTDVNDSDIAVACNGYVAYSAVLLDMATNMTDRRKISAICVIPGALRLEGEQGHFNRITEAKKNDVVSGRLLSIAHPVELFSRDRGFHGLDEGLAFDKRNTEVQHLISAYDDPLRRSIYLATFLNPTVESGHSLVLPQDQARSLIPTSWEQSIEAITFAHHTWKYNMVPAQEKSLAERWQEKGYLESDNMQWCSVGQWVGSSKRYISTTSCNEELRFFEAGNLADCRKLFIRQKRVPLIQCIKEAIEICGDDPSWAIIS